MKAELKTTLLTLVVLSFASGVDITLGVRALRDGRLAPGIGGIVISTCLMLAVVLILRRLWSLMPVDRGE